MKILNLGVVLVKFGKKVEGILQFEGTIKDLLDALYDLTVKESWDRVFVFDSWIENADKVYEVMNFLETIDEYVLSEDSNYIPFKGLEFVEAFSLSDNSMYLGFSYKMDDQRVVPLLDIQCYPPAIIDEVRCSLRDMHSGEETPREPYVSYFKDGSYRMFRIAIDSFKSVSYEYNSVLINKHQYVNTNFRKEFEADEATLDNLTLKGLYALLGVFVYYECKDRLYELFRKECVDYTLEWYMMCADKYLKNSKVVI